MKHRGAGLDAKLLGAWPGPNLYAYKYIATVTLCDEGQASIIMSNHAILIR